MKKYLTLFLLLYICNSKLFGQIHLPAYGSPNAISSTGQSGTGANYDVKFQKMWLRVSPDSALYLAGNVQTNFLTTQDNVTSISFDLNGVFIVDSVYYEETKLPAGNITRAGNILNIALGTSLPLDTYDSVRVYYQGVPPYYGGPEGFRKLTANGYNYMMSVSESYEDRDWWPCKADMQDKVDTMEIKVNVPWASPSPADTFWVVSNGKLIDSTISGNSRTFTYRSNYPIASYLVSVSVGRFNHYYRGSVNISGTDVPIVYNLLIGRTVAAYNSNLATMDKMKLVLAAYSQKFGDYPFKNEQFGYYDGLVGAGGIEHQTVPCIATGALNISTLAHEMMHQWFGDNVSASTWNDIWLAEGFAQYSESLIGELVPSLGVNAYSVRNSIKTSALSYKSNSTWIPNPTSNTSGFWSTAYGSIIYKRGAMVASMLRTMCGDAKYFQALANYQTMRGGKSANADTLKNYFNAILGADLTPFFNDYVGGSGTGTVAVGGIGNPINNINWSNPTSNQLVVQVASQTKTAGSNVAYFRGPVVLHIKGSIAAQDTTVVFFDWGGGNLSYAGNGLSAPISGNLLTYNLSFVPVTVAYDDSARTMSTGTTVNVTVLGLKVLKFEALKTGSGNQINLSIIKDQAIESIRLLRSYDGINFQEIGQMVEKPVYNLSSDYYYNDIGVGPTIFYKAEMVSNQKNEFTKVVKVQSLSNSVMTIIPNPADKSVNISFNNDNREKTTLNVISAEGQRLIQLPTNSNNVQFNSENLANGVYTIQLIQNNVLVQTKKLVIHH